MEIKSQIYDYLNKPKYNTILSDDDFNKLLPILVTKLEKYGFYKIIYDYNSKFLVDINKDWNNLKKYIIDSNNISAQTTVGLSIIKHFMTHIYDVKNYKGKSISDLWTKENIEKVLIMNRKTHSTPYVSEIVRQLGFMAGTSKVTIYRPLLTKRIVEYFNAKNVLDVCVGWGGRMIGSVCIDDVKYTGIEPFTKTYSSLNQIKNTLKLQNVTLYNDKAEHILSSHKFGEKFDLAITSPPYYNLEIYSDENTQSHHYGSYSDWYESFLKPVVHGTINNLHNNGKSCWSVKNFKTDKTYNLYDDIVKLHEEKGWRQMDIEFYIGNSIRPGCKNKEGNGKKSKEITYIFYKP
jgi:16S rRNA G966 N2-methylase RsmD